MFRFARALSSSVHGAATYKGTMKGLLFVGLAALLWMLFDFSVSTSVLISFIAYLAAGGWRFADVVIHTLPRDAR